MGSFILYGILFSIPLYYRIIIALRNPLVVDASGTAFVGHYRKWQVNALTGQVAGTSTHTTTSTQTTYETVHTDYGTRQHVSGVHTSTSVHDTLLLVDPAGRQHSFTLTNFGLEVFNGQVASLCTAKRGKKSVNIAVLNHSTRRQFTKNRELWRLVNPHGTLLGCWLVISLLLAGLVSLVYEFSGFFVFDAILIGSVAASAVVTNRQFRRFRDSGMKALWDRTDAAAETC
jgi:hypothetical protein